MSAGAEFLASVRPRFVGLRELAEGALSQLDDEGFFAPTGPDGTSVAVIVKHLAGNLRSRWTDFLTTDGEKPDRQRDREFALAPEDTRAALMDAWEAGWGVLMGALDGLEEPHLTARVAIRGEPHVVLDAILRQVAHYGYHVGQIVLLTRTRVGDGWRFLSTPPGGSAAFEERMRKRHDAG